MFFLECIESKNDGNRIFVLHNTINLTLPPDDIDAIDPNDLRSDPGLVGYLLGGETARGEGVISDGGGDVASVAVEQIFGTPSEYNITADPDLIPLNQQLPSISYDIFNNSNLTSRLTDVASQLAGFEVGDYVFIRSEPHGFLITGWGVATDCSSTTEIVPNVNVPYVADLPNEQVGTPRPFYCSRIADPERDGQWFAHRWWYFVKVPDRMFIKFTRLFSPDPIHEPMGQ